MAKELWKYRDVLKLRRRVIYVERRRKINSRGTSSIKEDRWLFVCWERKSSSLCDFKPSTLDSSIAMCLTVDWAGYCSDFHESTPHSLAPETSLLTRLEELPASSFQLPDPDPDTFYTSLMPLVKRRAKTQNPQNETET